MSGNMIFQAAVLRGGKQGIIVPDAQGYYTQCIGGLDVENAGGIIYSAEKARNLFLSDASLMRRVQDRALRGELGHPKRTAEFLDDQAWYMRLNEIYEDKTCVYWSKIWLDENYGRNNPHLNRPNMIGIMAQYRPGGIGGHVLERDLGDPNANVSFSIRSFSMPRRQGMQRFYDLQSIVTWDYVTEPGIACAMKTLSSTMESRAASMQEFETMPVSTRVVQRLADSLREPANDSNRLRVSNESRNNILELAGTLRVDLGKTEPKSIYYRW